MSNKQKTAVEWFMEQIGEKQPNGLYVIDTLEDVQNVFQQAKEMEKEQKKHAYDWGETNGADECNGDGATYENFEQYYKETYGGNK
jgi:hypothetical protein